MADSCTGTARLSPNPSPVPAAADQYPFVRLILFTCLRATHCLSNSCSSPSPTRTAVSFSIVQLRNLSLDSTVEAEKQEVHYYTFPGRPSKHEAIRVHLHDQADRLDMSKATLTSMYTGADALFPKLA